MTKSLSQQLCELCGIEPKYFIELYNGSFIKYDNETVYNRNLSNFDNIKNTGKLFVDFEKPSNFVPLLEIIHESGTEINNRKYNCEDNFVDCFLLDWVSKFKEYPNRYLLTKGTIKEAEWEY